MIEAFDRSVGWEFGWNTGLDAFGQSVSTKRLVRALGQNIWSKRVWKEEAGFVPPGSDCLTWVFSHFVSSVRTVLFGFDAVVRAGPLFGFEKVKSSFRLVVTQYRTRKQHDREFFVWVGEAKLSLRLVATQTRTCKQHDRERLAPAGLTT